MKSYYSFVILSILCLCLVGCGQWNENDVTQVQTSENQPIVDQNSLTDKPAQQQFEPLVDGSISNQVQSLAINENQLEIQRLKKLSHELAQENQQLRNVIQNPEPLATSTNNSVYFDQKDLITLKNFISNGRKKKITKTSRITVLVKRPNIYSHLCNLYEYSNGITVVFNLKYKKAEAYIMPLKTVEKRANDLGQTEFILKTSSIYNHNQKLVGYLNFERKVSWGLTENLTPNTKRSAANRVPTRAVEYLKFSKAYMTNNKGIKTAGFKFRDPELDRLSPHWDKPSYKVSGRQKGYTDWVVTGKFPWRR